MTLDELAAWVPTVPGLMPSDMQAMAQAICAEMVEPMERLQQLGLGYLSLDRASSTLSTGERQRVQLARAVRNRTCGVLYVLDEPSIGLHPSNVEGLLGVVDDLLADGNSVVLVDHDVRVLRQADHLMRLVPARARTAGASSRKARWKRWRLRPKRASGRSCRAHALCACASARRRNRCSSRAQFTWIRTQSTR